MIHRALFLKIHWKKRTQICAQLQQWFDKQLNEKQKQNKEVLKYRTENKEKRERDSWAFNNI